MTTDWLSAGAMILSGLIVGFMFWYGMKGRAAKPDTELRDLEAKRDVLLQQLRELKETGGSTEERARLERETADVLRKIDGRASAPLAPAATSAAATTDVNIAALTRAASIRGFLWGAGSVALLGGIGWFVTQQATPRTDNAAGPMQNAAAAQSQQQQKTDPAVQQLEAAVAKSPDDLEARHELAKAYLERENLMGVFEQTQYILKRSPDDARALTYQSLVRLSMGQPEGATEMLQHAIKSDPQLTDAYVALAWANMQAGRVSEAESLMAEAGKRRPDQKARLDEVLTRMKEQAKNPAPAMPPNHPDLPAAGSSDAAAAAAGPALHVTVSLASGVKASPNAVLFLIARNPGQTAGPPAAVKRIVGPTFPLELDLSQADSMMGQPLPATVRLEARLDADGDPLTKNASDPKALQEGVATNGARVALMLQ